MFAKRTSATLFAAMCALIALPAAAAQSLTVPLVAAAPAVSGTDAFPAGATVTTSWNATENRSADEPATVHAVSDGQYMYVRFDVNQREAMIGAEGGDNVSVDLWPSGGDVYHFAVDSNGKRDASNSSANTAGWEAAASTRAGGYTVTMRIPLSACGGGSSSSMVQFSRWIASTGETQVWAHDSGAGSDVAQGGTITFATSVGAAQK